MRGLRRAFAFRIGFLIAIDAILVALALSEIKVFAQIAAWVILILVNVFSVTYLWSVTSVIRRYIALPRKKVWVFFESDTLYSTELPISVMRAYVSMSDEPMTAESLKTKYDFLLDVGFNTFPPEMNVIDPKMCEIALKEGVPVLLIHGEPHVALISGVIEQGYGV